MHSNPINSSNGDLIDLGQSYPNEPKYQSYHISDKYADSSAAMLSNEGQAMLSTENRTKSNYTFNDSFHYGYRDSFKDRFNDNFNGGGVGKSKSTHVPHILQSKIK